MKMNIAKKTDYAVTSVVVSILILGLFVTMIATIQTVYVPKWMSQKEAEHMDEVSSQFADLKYAIDIQSALEQTTPIATPITLGSRELPYFMSSRAFGSLSILSTAGNVTITNDTASFSYKFGTIKYSSKNVYYINKKYIYETGAVVLNQSQGDIMSIKPPFTVNYSTTANILFNVINISGVGSKSSISGYSTFPIQTEFSSSSSTVINNVKNITISTTCRNAWKSFLNTTLKESGLNSDGYGANFTITTDSNSVTVSFTDETTVNLTRKIIIIKTQIAHGWVE